MSFVALLCSRADRAFGRNSALCSVLHGSKSKKGGMWFVDVEPKTKN